jgi:hypothetical protein
VRVEDVSAAGQILCGKGKVFCEKQEKGSKMPDQLSASQNNGWARRWSGSLPVCVKIDCICCPITMAILSYCPSQTVIHFLETEPWINFAKCIVLLATSHLMLTRYNLPY